MSGEGFLQSLVNIVSDLLEPLNGFASAGSLKAFLSEFGWVSTILDKDMQLINDSFGLLTDINTLASIKEDLGEDIAKSKQAIELIKSIITKVNHFPQPNNLANYPFPFSKTQFWSSFPKDALEYLVHRFFEVHHPRIYGALLFLGVLSRVQTPADSSSGRAEFLRKGADFGRLSGLLTDFKGSISDYYNWKSTKSFSFQLLQENLIEVFGPLAIGAALQPPSGEFISQYYESSSPFLQTVSQMVAYLYEYFQVNETGDSTIVSLALVVAPIPPSDHKAGAPNGLMIAPVVSGTANTKFNLSDYLSLEMRGGFESDAGVRIVLKPDSIQFLSSHGADLNAEAKLVWSKPAPIILLGSLSTSHLEIFSIEGIFYANYQGGKENFGAEIGINQAAIVVAAENGDGFVQRILSVDPMQINFNLALGVSNQRGLYISGGGGLAYHAQINESFGPIFIYSVDILLDTQKEENSVSLIAAVSGSAKIGPVALSVQKMGLEAILDSTHSGLLGSADLSLAFKPPSGIGLAIDADMVRGGGSLAIDNGNYTGAVALEIQDKISVSAVGILITRTENGEKTFSFKILGCAEFDPVQVGFGFSISGVGLVVAIDCRMDEEALRAAVYGGTLRSLLFPADIVARAPQIIRNLNKFFPTQADTYVVGAMVKLGWGGGEPIVKADVGLFFEFGSNIRIAMAGIAYAKLPSEQSPILVLQVQVLGILDFANKTLAIDASLTGSRILSWALDGDLALRAAWGDTPRFALSAGGFYPGYKPPAGFPSLRRVSLSLSTGNPRISLQGYFAVTENSVQFGACLLFYWSKDCCWPIDLIEIEGTIGFNALFQFNPFYFETDFFATFCLKRNGDRLLSVDLYLWLSGPNNYHVIGNARAEICHIGFSVDFDKRFGAMMPEAQQILSGREILAKELQNMKNWSGREPADGPRGTILRDDRSVEKLLEPRSTLCFRQRSIPLGYNLARIGHAVPQAGERWFDLVPGNGQAEELAEFFAPGDFLDLSNNQKVSGPAFEKMKAGLAIQAGQSVEWESAAMTSRPLKYETTFIRAEDGEGENWKIRLPRGNPFTRTKAVTQTEIRSGRRRYTYAPPLLEPVGTGGRYAVNEQKVAAVIDAYCDGFEPAKAHSGKTISQASYSQVRQALESSAPGGGAHIVDAAKAAKPRSQERPG